MRDNALTDGVALRSGNTGYIFYKEDTDSIWMDLSGMSGSQVAIAVDTKQTPYQETSLGVLSPAQQTQTLPYISDWAIAVGDFVPPQLTVIKTVVNDNGGTAAASEWTMYVTGTNVSSTNFPGQETPGVTVTLDAGSYSVDESGGPAGYVKSLSADCSGTIAMGESKTCTITSDDICAGIFCDGFESGDTSPWSKTIP